MEVPVSLLARMLLANNDKIARDICDELGTMDLKLIHLNWPPEKMEKYYLQDLEKLVEGDKVENETMQRFFSDYVSLRNVLVSEKRPYNPITTNHLKEPNPRLHYEKADKI